MNRPKTSFSLSKSCIPLGSPIPIPEETFRRDTIQHQALKHDDATATPTGSSHAMVPLARDFVPGDDDVICGRGKKCFNHRGNERFREQVWSRLSQYSAATSKMDKSFIISTIVNEVRKNSPSGGFVKQDLSTGRWFEVGNFLAREKTSQAFRDALHESYRSSNKSKKKRRQEEQQAAAEATFCSKAPRLENGRSVSVGSSCRPFAGCDTLSLPGKIEGGDHKSSKSTSVTDDMILAHAGQTRSPSPANSIGVASAPVGMMVSRGSTADHSEFNDELSCEWPTHIQLERKTVKNEDNDDKYHNKTPNNTALQQTGNMESIADILARLANGSIREEDNPFEPIPIFEHSVSSNISAMSVDDDF